MPKLTLLSILFMALMIPFGCTSGDHSVGSANEKMPVPSMEGYPEAGPDAGPNTERDAGPSGDASSCDSTQRIAESGALEAFAPFQQSRMRWTDALSSASNVTAAAPRPSLLGPGDPLTFDFWSQYVGSDGWAGFPGSYHPFGVPRRYVAVEGEESQLAEFASLVLGGDLPSNLARLTDFSTAGGAPRVAALCDAYLASAKEPEVEPLQALCGELGSIVHAEDVADLKVDGVKLLRAKECGLPSAAYGAYKSVGQDMPLSFDWPDYLARDSKFRQPCVGAYLHVSAEDRGRNPIAKGWLFVKAVADLTAVPFPYRERDPEFGEVAGRDGAPRGEFVSTRQLFTSGASLYLGTSPLWLLHRDELPSFPALVAALEGRTPACDLSPARPATPCILPPQKPFLFPSDISAVWVRQALDSLNPGHQPGSMADRNPSELHLDTTVLGDMLTAVLRFYDSTRFVGLERGALGGHAEQLGAMFHAFRLYQGRFDLKRLRTPMLPLGDGFFLAVPDQGYLQLGSPTPETLSKLLALDLTAALGVDRPNCSDSLFTFNDVIPAEGKQ
jgi:hypothetical protein